MQRWSDVRLASSLNLVDMDGSTLDSLLYRAQSAGIARRAGKELTAPNGISFAQSMYARRFAENIDPSGIWR